MSISDYTSRYLREAAAICQRVDHAEIDAITRLLAAARDAGGRIFFLGVGGGAGNAAHAVNDFRKIAGFESYAPTDNVLSWEARGDFGQAGLVAPGDAGRQGYFDPSGLHC